MHVFSKRRQKISSLELQEKLEPSKKTVKLPAFGFGGRTQGGLWLRSVVSRNRLSHWQQLGGDRKPVKQRWRIPSQPGSGRFLIRGLEMIAVIRPPADNDEDEHKRS